MVGIDKHVPITGAAKNFKKVTQRGPNEVHATMFGKNPTNIPTQMVVKNGDESHGRIRKKSPTKTNKRYIRGL